MESLPAPAPKIVPLGNGSQEAVLFAFEIPYLPDFLLDHTLMNESDPGRLEEVLDRFQRFVIGFRKYRDSAYALRFSSVPAEGRVDVHLLCRFVGPAGWGQAEGRQRWSDIQAHLTAYGLPRIPLSADAPGGIDRLLTPFDQRPAIVEIRQRELLVPLMAVNKEAYVIHPYWKPRGVMLEPFETMLRQPHPVVLSIYLEPTELGGEEAKAISEAGYLAQTVADMDVPVQSTTGIRRRRDPGAELVGRIYSQYHKSLEEPFLMVVQAASSDPNAAWTVARAYASSMTSGYSHLDGADTGDALPSNTDLVSPRTPDEQTRAGNTFSHLLWSPWGASRATPNKERLPYLCGPSGASCAFRFPVSVRGGVPGIAVRQLPPDFEPGARPPQAENDELHLGNFRRGGSALARVKDLSRHALITGFTGSGKTNTVLYLLDQLWRKHRIPFLVIEAAKKEYRALSRVSGFEDLLVFTLGDETGAPFRLNPFELIPGVRLEAHLGRLQACFDAALPQFGILPSIIAEAMENIYRARGWKATDRAEAVEKKIFPTMRDMLAEVIRVAEERGYAGETYHNIRAAAAGRIGGLLRGSKGSMFGCQRSYPAEELFKRPVILELNDLNEDDKALTMMYLLTWMREYRELHPSKHLQHVTVVEEAHNVLSNTQSVGNSEVAADTKAKSVGAFSNMLSEVRAYGEGIIISDQSPEKLAPDAMRNTNLQIAHQLRDRNDRDAIARAMIMDDAQRDYLGKLRVGEAALFQTGLERATFIIVPEYKDSAGFDNLPGDAEIQARMAGFTRDHLKASLPFDGCRFCASPCQYREVIAQQTLNKEIHTEFRKALAGFDEHPEPEYWPQNWREVARVCASAGRSGGHPEQLDAAYCYLAHEIDFKFTQHMRRMFETAFGETLKGG